MDIETEGPVPKSFVQDLENNVFLLDGSPFTPMSGEMHYFRVPRTAWEDRLTKIKEANLNCVTTAVEWGLHEPNPGLYVFENELDLKAFINLAAACELLVILKIGPQSSPDRDFGGLPHWLLSVNTNIKCRAQDESFTYFFGRWLRTLYGHIQSLLAGMGGPIIMIQIEDAYGSNPIQDRNYLFWLRDLNNSLVGKNAILFTSDFPDKGCIERGRIPGVLATIKFGASTEPIMNHFEELRKVQPQGPLMNSQFWVGCPTYWKDSTHNKLDVQILHDDLTQMIAMGISFNLYMFHGGTNFGLSAGLKTEGKYCLTSYDFDAPISESGDLTLKYVHIQKFIAEIGRELEDRTEEERVEEIQILLEGTETPETTEKGEYGTVILTPVDSLLNTQMTCCLKSCISLFPKSMEEMNLRDGLMAYSTILKDGAEKDAELRGTVRDRAYVIINNTETIGIIENGDALKLPKSLEEKSKITFLVENQGRPPYKSGRTVTKGLFNMYLNGNLLDNWTITTFSIQGPKSIMKLQNNLRRKVRKSRQQVTKEPIIPDPFVAGFAQNEQNPKQDEVIAPPAFYIGTFVLPKDKEGQGDESIENEAKINELNLESDISYENFGDIIKDSFLNMSGWKKGIVYLNSYCLGRYWDVGPQRTLFVPGSFLLPYPWKNKMTILELEAAPQSLKVTFSTTSDPELSDISDEPAFGQAKSGDKKDEDAAVKIPSGAGGGNVPSSSAAEKVPSATADENKESMSKVDSAQEE